MPRRQQRRPVVRKGAPKAPHEDTGALVRDLEQLRDEADRVAFQEPSPEALREYRRTNRELVEAQRALAMVTGR